jgi:rhodanese-related sulfurtransferase
MPDNADRGARPQILGEHPRDYAGDVSAEEAWRVLEANPDAVLVDVRTQAEWSFVGLPDLSSLGKQALLLEWQSYPAMRPNTAFASELAAKLGSALGEKAKDVPVLFLCRSGARSRSAAVALTAMGFRAAHNVAHGFEGDLDGERHRGHQNGWKAAGLPWTQG